MMMNSTIEKFGYPSTVIAEYDHWVVMIREKQISAGCLILACKEEEVALPNISAHAFSELKKVTSDIESNLQRIVQFEKINYIVLMMVDPHVHFHVIPRYSGERQLAGFVILDAGWPKHPAFQDAVSLTSGDLATICSTIRGSWEKG